MTEEEKILLVIKDDIDNLVHRLNAHFEDYMRVFTQKRTRGHFKDVFFSRFREVNVTDLVKLQGEILLEVNNFYYTINELHWYVKVTEDMPSMVENKIKSELSKVNNIATKINELAISGSVSLLDVSGAQIEVDTSTIFNADSETNSESEDEIKTDAKNEIELNLKSGTEDKAEVENEVELEETQADELDLPPPFEDDVT